MWQGHQGDDAAVRVVVGNLIRIGNERDLFEEFHQGGFLIRDRELLGDGFEFREVLDSRFILRIGRLLQFA